jgi:chromatin licensing and DNA replication factor 1
MAQPSVSTFFITRKRGIEDEILSNKKKVICLDRTHNSSESEKDSEDLCASIVHPKNQEYSSNDEESKKTARKATVRQGITPQRTTRSRKVHMQEVDGIKAPKIVNFFKGGNLSPQKKAKEAVDSSKLVPVATISDGSIKQAGMSTPKKSIKEASTSSDAIEKTSLMTSNGMKLDEIKKKLKGSTKLAALKTSLNKLNSGFDKLDQMETKRVAAAEAQRVKASGSAPEMVKGLKPFVSLELEILR